MKRRLVDDRTITLVIGIDDGFAVPALVMLRSACRNLSPGWEIEVFIFGHRVSPASREMIASGLAGLPVRLRWREPDLGGARERLPGIRRDGDVTVYFRLLIGEELPESIQRAVFLDVDILVEGDLAELWNRPFDGHVIQAVPDAYARTLHLPRLGSIAGTTNVPFGCSAAYFNAGVQLIDLQAWRADDTGRRALDFLLEHRKLLRGRDQDALNCVLAGRWKPLPPTWNLHELPHCLFLWERGALSAAELRQTFQNPKIVHFIGHWQPWGHTCSQMFHQRWREVAREAGVDQQPPPLLRSLWHRVIREPHSRLNWYVWRTVIQAADCRQWHHLAIIVLTHPWMVVTYPLWQAKVWADFCVRRPFRRWVWRQLGRLRVRAKAARAST
jgi:lipopolysaccharide biosynthesis glycosyltransferase